MYQILVNEKEPYTIELEQETPLIDGQRADWDLQQLPNGSYSVLLNGKSHVVRLAHIDKVSKTVELFINGNRYFTEIKEPLDQLLDKMGLNLRQQKKAESIKAPMPGLVLKILVKEGSAIKKGDPVLVLEAMKMENVFKATTDAFVKSIKATEGSAVEKGAILIELE